MSKENIKNTLEDRYNFDREVTSKMGIFAGVDEAGRGPLVGDVYAAAVILDLDNPIVGINDSKKISEKKRESLFDEICEKAVGYGIGIGTRDEIEEINILNAAMLAMKRAIENLEVKPEFIIVDGNKVPNNIEIVTESLVSGDQISASIGAASILAKVSRDRAMRELDKKYPEYNFAKNKGYGTKEHREALQKYGPCPQHRLSFLKKILG